MISAIKDREAVLSVSEGVAARVASVYPVHFRLIRDLKQSWRATAAYAMSHPFARTQLGHRAHLACAIWIEGGFHDFLRNMHGLKLRSLRGLTTSEYDRDEAKVTPIAINSFLVLVKPAIISLGLLPLLVLVVEFFRKNRNRVGTTGIFARKSNERIISTSNRPHPNAIYI